MCPPPTAPGARAQARRATLARTQAFGCDMGPPLSMVATEYRPYDEEPLEGAEEEGAGAGPGSAGEAMHAEGGGGGTPVGQDAQDRVISAAAADAAAGATAAVEQAAEVQRRGEEALRTGG